MTGKAYRNTFDMYVGISEDKIHEYWNHVDEANQNISELNKKYIKFIHQQRLDVQELGDRFTKTIQTMETTNADYYATANKRLAELESTYQEKLRLQAPADYWKTLKDSYQHSGWGWLILSGLIAAGIIVFLCVVLFENTELLTENANWIDNVKSSAILTVITSIAVYILRLTSKMSLSSFHLSKDAKERESLAYFDLSLMEKSAVTEKERAIILNALFSRSDTGLLKGDSAPTMSSNVSDLVELFKKTQN